VHGDAHPELLEIQKIFNKTSGELAAHMKKEELIVFPFIKKLALAKEKRIAITSKLFDSIVSPIKQMNDDHLDEGEQLQRMAALSNNYTPPLDACHSYSTAYQMLHEYEKDMHRHIHLENNLLFPRAIQLETKMLKSAITGNINEN
jgi:regulator of cell morphogenesis and NO signaling